MAGMVEGRYEIMAGMVEGRYEIVASLGRGGMGEVFLANDLVLHRRVAIKKILTPSGGGYDGQAVDRLVREARLAAVLQHPNVVAVHDLIADDQQTYIVMEYVQARSLSEMIRAQGTLTPIAVAEIGVQVAAALEAAHRAGICHRDVKPANILVDDQGVAKLADFGVARSSGDASLTGTGMMIGSVAFMAPEVAKGEPATAAADVYSLGATLFAAVEGHAPFARGSEPAEPTPMLVRLITEEAPVPVRGGLLTGLIGQLMAVDPADRPTAAEARQQLTLTLSDAAGHAVTGAVGVPGRSDVDPTRRRPVPGTPQSHNQPTHVAAARNVISLGVFDTAVERDPTVFRGSPVAPSSGHTMGGPASVGPLSTPPQPQRRPSSSRRGAPMLWILGAVALVAVLGGAGTLAVLQPWAAWSSFAAKQSTSAPTETATIPTQTVYVSVSPESTATRPTRVPAPTPSKTWETQSVSAGHFLPPDDAVRCPSGTLKAPETSCGFADAVKAQAEKRGPGYPLTFTADAYSEVRQKWYPMACTTYNQWVVCQGGDRGTAFVYVPR